LSCLKR